MGTSEPESDHTHDAQRQESLAQIATQWSLLRLAHADAVVGSQAARQALLLRYSRAVRRFVGLLVKDSAAADDVAQDAMVRLMRGDFAQADADRGRFRDLLRQAIRNMVRNYWSREKLRAGIELDEQQFAVVDDAQQDLWLQQWTSVVLETAWRALEDYQKRTPGSILPSPCSGCEQIIPMKTPSNWQRRFHNRSVARSTPLPLVSNCVARG